MPHIHPDAVRRFEVSGSISCMLSMMYAFSTKSTRAQTLAGMGGWQMWAELIRAAEEPLPLSAREGRALKLVSPQQHLPPQRLRDTLEALFQVSR